MIMNYNEQFLYKRKYKTKIISTKRGVKGTLIASQGRYEFVKINKFVFVIEGEISKKVINVYMKYNNISLWWRKFFLSIAKNRGYFFNFCNRPNGFDRHRREWYLYNLLRNSNNNQDELAEHNMYWGNW